MQVKVRPNDKQKALLRAMASRNLVEARAATETFAKALELPLRQAILSGDVFANLPVFEVEPVDGTNSTVEYPLDIVNPGQETNFVAYTISSPGYIPQRTTQGDYVMVPTYKIANAIDWDLDIVNDARWNMVARYIEVFNFGFTKKISDDGAHTLLAAAADRNIVVSDSDASAGQFTKRLVSLMKTVMVRNGGGNSSSVNRGRLTDLVVSPEALEDIRNWNVDQVDETTRREIFLAEDGTLNRIFGVNLHDWAEFGEGQEYETYLEDELGATLPGSDVEAVLGLDLSKNLGAVMPVRENVTMFDDSANLHRYQRAGVYGWGRMGFAVLDGRMCLLGSL